jgi:hypothetical protein
MGRADVNGMLAEITAEQFVEWVAYSDVEPWGEERADLRAGIIAAEIANTPPRFFGKAGKVRPADCMPKFGREPEKPQTGRQMAVAAMAWAFAVNRAAEG